MRDLGQPILASLRLRVLPLEPLEDRQEGLIGHHEARDRP